MILCDEAQARAWVKELPDLDLASIARLDKLVALLADENSRQNLISSASLAEIWRRHIADSAQLSCYAPATASPWLDLGTGAGFPGLVIAALRPRSQIFLVESRKRRIEWLERVREELELDRVKIVGARLEDVASLEAAVISARAFAPLDRLLALAARFSTRHTLWLLPKGRSAPQELNSLRGWPHMFHVEPSLTDAEAGIIVGTLPSASSNRPEGSRL